MLYKSRLQHNRKLFYMFEVLSLIGHKYDINNNLELIIQQLENQIIHPLTHSQQSPYKMKNKTHRIISISPTSQNTSIRSTTKKTTTPIKPIQHPPTRPNTIKTIFKADDSQVIEEEREGALGSIVVSSYKGEEDRCRSGKGKERKAPVEIDEILERIGKISEGNASTQLIKKTHISYLREYIRQAKNMIKLREQNQGDPFSYNHSTNTQLQAQSSALREKISTFFSILHKELYSKQKSLYQQLDQKIFQLKQKNITKCYQIATLKNYIEVCESDINNNYEGIITEIRMEQLEEIVKSYTNRLEFYMGKIREAERLRVQLPERVDLWSKLGECGVVIEKVDGEGLNIPQNSILSPVQLNNRLSLQRPTTQARQTPQNPKLSFDKRLNIKSAFEQAQNLPLSRLISKKLKNGPECEPRIASARGKY